MNKEIMDVIRKKGLLLEKEIYDLINSIDNIEIAKVFLEQLEKIAGQKIITKNILNKNVEFARSIFTEGENKKYIEKVFVNFGVSVEVRREKEILVKTNEDEGTPPDYKIFYADTSPDKKLEVKDFTGNFRARFQQLQRILMQETHWALSGLERRKSRKREFIISFTKI